MDWGGRARSIYRGIRPVLMPSLWRFCDWNESVLKPAAEKFGVKRTYGDYKEMLCL